MSYFEELYMRINKDLPHTKQFYIQSDNGK